MKNPKPRFVIVDVDGTIADVRHRLHHIQGPGKKNWARFFAGMDRDTPIPNIIEYVGKLAENHKILIVTGRPEQYRARTESWLARHEIPYEKLFMRRQGDHRPDYEAKIEVLKHVPPKLIALAIDDRPPVCDMWEKYGIQCLRVQSDEQNQQVNEFYRGRPSPTKRRKRTGTDN